MTHLLLAQTKHPPLLYLDACLQPHTVPHLFSLLPVPPLFFAPKEEEEFNTPPYPASTLSPPRYLIVGGEWKGESSFIDQDVFRGGWDKFNKYIHIHKTLISHIVFILSEDAVCCLVRWKDLKYIAELELNFQNVISGRSTVQYIPRICIYIWHSYFKRSITYLTLTLTSKLFSIHRRVGVYHKYFLSLQYQNMQFQRTYFGGG